MAHSPSGSQEPFSSPFVRWLSTSAFFNALFQRFHAEPLPAWDMAFSADAAYRRVSGQGVATNEWGYGIRWAMGFSLAQMFIAAGSDNFITTAGEVERSPMVRYGLTFSLPTTRIIGVAKIADYSLRKKRKKFLPRFELPPDHKPPSTYK